MHRHSPKERRQTEFDPHFGSWANSLIVVLEAVRKLLKQLTFEDVGHIFGQREWYPHSNAALPASVVLRVAALNAKAFYGP